MQVQHLKLGNWSVRLGKFCETRGKALWKKMFILNGYSDFGTLLKQSAGSSTCEHKENMKKEQAEDPMSGVVRDFNGNGVNTHFLHSSSIYDILGSNFDRIHPDGGSMALRNVGILPQHNRASYPRRPRLEVFKKFLPKCRRQNEPQSFIGKL
jgi:hypothetical protein